jgi:hypothetical protein
MGRFCIKMKTFSYSRFFILLAALLILILSGCSRSQAAKTTDAPPTQMSAATTLPHNIGIAVVGDSISDEYQADDARGGNYSDVTLNWVELLVKTRDLNFGTWGNWPPPRRTGYEYNWARSGATINSMIESGQHTGVAQQVAEGKVSFVLIWIGNNDFHLTNGSYESIYSGELSDADIQQRNDGFVKKLTTAMDTILQAGDVKVGIVTVADQGLTGPARFLYPDGQKRQRVTDAIDELNAKLIKAARERDVLVIDSNEMGKAILARVDMLGNLQVGDAKINILVKGNEPHHLQLLDDSGHPGTVASGIIANHIFIQPLNDAFGLNITPLTDQEILDNAGIQ